MSTFDFRGDLRPADTDDTRPHYGRTFVTTPAPPPYDGPITRFRFWYSNAEEGDRITYYHGFLLLDRYNRDGTENDLSELARVVWGYAMKRLVALVQRRVDAGVYDYIAAKLR